MVGARKNEEALDSDETVEAAHHAAVAVYNELYAGNNGPSPGVQARRDEQQDFEALQRRSRILHDRIDAVFGISAESDAVEKLFDDAAAQAIVAIGDGDSAELQVVLHEVLLKSATALQKAAAEDATKEAAAPRLPKKVTNGDDATAEDAAPRDSADDARLRAGAVAARLRAGGVVYQ